ncbi:MAG: protein-disulfide reductase DsbD, partial [Gammaproteobacteria bacterium]|nr:protein-disulfide reductase DsbD [Gammaproteobacteria bacterium]
MTLTCLALMQTPALANDPLKDLFKSNSSFLDVDEAFQFSYVQNGEELELYWQIADDYYLYADKFQFSIENATLGDVTKPSGTQIEDEFFGVTNVYFFEAQLNVLVSDITDNAILNVRYQGCAKAGLCYNPVVKKVPLEAIVTANSADMATRLLAAEQTSDDSFEPTDENISEQHKLASLFENQSLWLTLLAFFALGVGLAFTPCVFPMFPILSGIIAGQKDLTVKRGLMLSFIYAQGMALTYSLLGLVVASMGSQFQAYLQHPSVLIATSVLFVFLAASMFGWINLQLPQSWTSRLTEVSNQQKSGKSLGVFLMGALSGLIASPCTTAPLTGALLYVAQTGDLVIGFVTLYVLSLGMGLPLLLIGASGGSLLPKAGNWMNVVKVIFG